MTAITPTKTKTDVLTADQAACVDRLRVYHAASKKSAGDHLSYTFLTGLELERLAGTSTNSRWNTENNFKTLHETFFPEISKSAVYRYRQFFNRFKDRLPTVGILSQPKLLANGDLPAETRDKISKEIHDQADGKTVTELWRDLDIIRAPKPVGRKDGETPRKLSLSEQAELRKELAHKDWSAIDKGLFVYKDKFTVLGDDDVTAQIARLEQALKARRAWLKQPRNKREPKAILAMFEPNRIGALCYHCANPDVLATCAGCGGEFCVNCSPHSVHHCKKENV